MYHKNKLKIATVFVFFVSIFFLPVFVHASTYFWTTNGGSSGQYTWDSIASSADGTKLAAASFSGYIYTSTNSGLTWSTSTSAGSRSWYSITSSADGTKLAAADGGNGYIYTSTHLLTLERLGLQTEDLQDGMIGNP